MSHPKPFPAVLPSWKVPLYSGISDVTLEPSERLFSVILDGNAHCGFVLVLPVGKYLAVESSGERHGLHGDVTNAVSALLAAEFPTAFEEQDGTELHRQPPEAGAEGSS